LLARPCSFRRRTDCSRFNSEVVLFAFWGYPPLPDDSYFLRPQWVSAPLFDMLSSAVSTTTATV
jgi:hypothetical protein